MSSFLSTVHITVSFLSAGSDTSSYLFCTLKGWRVNCSNFLPLSEEVFRMSVSDPDALKSDPGTVLC
jgi:hypothetical protein